MLIIRPITITDSILTSSNVTEADYPVYNQATVYPVLSYVMVTSLHKIYQSLKVVTGTVTISIAAPGIVTWANHGLATSTPISFTTTGALPTGIVASTEYYVLYIDANTFYLTASIGGVAFTTTGTQSGSHTITVKPGLTTTPAYWLDCGATNKWRMFDTSVNSQTINATTITNTYQITGKADAIALLNLSATTARVTMTDATDGVVYDKTVNLIATSGILDWYAYFFEPIISKTDVTFTDMPPYSSPLITITITGGTAAVGATIIGTQKAMGSLAQGAKVGITSYSTKTVDTFGNYTIVSRAYSKRANFTVMIDASYVSEAHRTLAAYRDVPIVYVGSDLDGYDATIIYGFYKDFSVDITYSTKAICTMEIEGLT